ncbi:MAG: ferritin-like domain-containing protein [Labilithrix sp.]|nr:ferritin-like domain-containing protein [Labilithrix sp.]MCW5815362.1 ferritin-like domain-containing protein [Labilithrix sp.]
MRHTLRLRVLLPALASVAAAACGGSTEEAFPSPAATSSGGTSSSSGGASSSSGGGSSSGGSSGSSSGSSGSSGTVVLDTDVCVDGEHKPGANVTIAGVDFFELREEYDHADPSQEPRSLGSTGTACASADDASACKATLTSLRSDGWRVKSWGNDVPRHRYGVTTKGNDVTAITSLAGLTSAIATVDSPAAAALLAVAEGANHVVCGKPNVKKTATGWQVLVQNGIACGEGTSRKEEILAVTTDGKITIEQSTVIEEGQGGCAIGRRPEGLVAHAATECADPVGRFFAAAAHLEAASVFSFERLTEELVALGAPEELVAASRASRDDEVRHARMTAKMARRFGGAPAKAEVAPATKRTTLEIALENATEGCVRETYGALVAHRQAKTANDRAIRRMMQTIAEDETKHAGLAWDVAAWLEPQLTTDERLLVDDARRRALADLRAELAIEPDADLRARAGMPEAAAALALLDALDADFIAAA